MAGAAKELPGETLRKMAERKERHSGRADQKTEFRPATPKLTHRTVEEFRGTALDVRDFTGIACFINRSAASGATAR